MLCQFLVQNDLEGFLKLEVVMRACLVGRQVREVVSTQFIGCLRIAKRYYGAAGERLYYSTTILVPANQRVLSVRCRW